MQTLVNWLAEILSLESLLQARLLASALVVALVLLARPLLLAIVRWRTEDATVHYRWRKIIGYASLLLGLIALAQVWLVGSRAFATYFGLLSAGLAVALKDPVSNVFGWLFIITRRPFEVGDRIQLDEVAGDVIDVRYFQFTLMEIGNWVDADQSTGRVIHVPNQKVFSEAVANYTKGLHYIWNEIPVVVTFESDWRRAKEILLDVVTEHSDVLSERAREGLRDAARRYLINYDKLTPIVYTKVADHGVVLTMRYLCDPRRRRGTEMAIWEAMLEAFAREPHIDLAYPTQRFYFHGEGNTAMEGKRKMEQETATDGEG
ncbi:MAG: mechanosensitive ion channel family protein [Chloroflexota bacterium]